MTDSETTTCPYCREEIRAAAIICKHCKRSVRPASTKAPGPALVPPIHLQVVASLTGMGVVIAAIMIANPPAVWWWRAIEFSWIPVLLIGVWQYAQARSVAWLLVLIVAGFVPRVLLDHLSEPFAVAFLPLLGTAYGVSASLRYPGSGEGAVTLRGAWILSACLIPILFLGGSFT